MTPQVIELSIGTIIVLYAVWYGAQWLMRHLMIIALDKLVNLMHKKIEAGVAGTDDIIDFTNGLVAIILGKDPAEFSREMWRKMEQFKKNMKVHYKEEPPKPDPVDWSRGK